MSMKHLKQGDTNPPVNEDTLRIYSMHFCPFAERARLVLAAKGIEHELVNCNLKSKPEFLLERNPAGKVPVLEYRGNVIAESLIVCDLIDELFPIPDKTLTARDPFKKAKDKLVVEQFAPVMGAFYGYLSHPDDDEKVMKLKSALSKFEVVLKARDAPFFGGDRAGMPDLMIWPWLERMEADVLNHYATLSAYKGRMNEVPAVKECTISLDVHRKFYESHQAGNPNYDLECN